MKYAIVSDIHANLDALDAVLTHAGSVPLLCLGDIVGDGGQPNECVQIIRDRAVHTVLGNVDLARSRRAEIDDVDSGPTTSALRTQRLSASTKEFLLALPYVVTMPTYALVHGSPHEPERYHYIDSERRAKAAFAACDNLITFVGHTHCPGIFVRDPDGRLQITEIIGDAKQYSMHSEIELGSRFIVNVGSTGEPRDRDHRASYVIYDDTALTIYWHRIEYEF